MRYFYFPALKTRESELRAYSELDEIDKETMLPILALTKSRISKNNPNGSLKRKLEQLQEEFELKPFILDLSTEESLINDEIERLLEPDNGFKNWVDFVIKCKKTFSKLIPCIHFDPTSIDNVKFEIQNLSSNFELMALRIDANDEVEKYLNDIQEVNLNNKIILILDCVETLSFNYQNLLKNLNLSIFKATICLNSTFPKTLPTKNENMYIKLKEQEDYFQNLKQFGICYGDFGCSYPIRYDTKARGWIPRIDLPIFNNNEYFIYYSKERMDIISSEMAYKKCADNLNQIREIREFRCENNWGYEIFEYAKNGYIIGKSPSFWISVRMNIYMALMARKFKNRANYIEIK